MNKINFQNGTKVSDAKVTIDGTDYTVTPASYSGTTPVSASNLNQLQTYIEQAIADITLPVGVVQAYAGATAPTGFLLCDGSAISRSTYSDLFNIIGTTYGVGDGSTTFNLPDLRGKHPMGYDSTQTEFNTLNKTGGEKKHTLTINQIPAHDHSISHVAVGLNAPGYNTWEENLASGTGLTYKASAKTNQTGDGQSFNVLDPYITMNYIIKY
jgi:microcystin-dependent protein